MCALRDDPGMAAVTGGQQAELVVQGGLNDGKIIPLDSGYVTMGRQPDNDIVLDEPAVSRRHAVIVAAGQVYCLRDLGSTNGTFVNRRRVSQGDYPLKHGDAVRLGGSRVQFLFRYVDSGTRTMRVSTLEHRPPPAATTEAGVWVDSKARQVYVSGRLVEPPLPRKEFDLLMLLQSRRGEAVSRDELAAAVWPERRDGDVGNHEIEQCVHRVRMRIEEDTSRPKHLVTVRGYGYMLV